VPDDFEVDLDLSGSFRVDGGTAFGINVTHVPKLQLGLDKVTLGVDKLTIGIDPLTINPLTLTPLTINPIDLWIGLKEVPRIRVHLPANFSLGLALFGKELASIRLCGEAQVVTEEYRPNPCEECTPSLRTQVDLPHLRISGNPDEHNG